VQDLVLCAVTFPLTPHIPPRSTYSSPEGLFMFQMQDWGCDGRWLKPGICLQNNLVIFSLLVFLQGCALQQQLCRYGGLTLAGCQVPTELLSHSPSSARQVEKVIWESLLVKIRTEMLLSSYHHGQNRLSL